MIAFDEQGHVIWRPDELFSMAVENPRVLINQYLLSGIPAAFSTREDYNQFLEAVADRTGVHPKNLSRRGSCQVGFSIAPGTKVWTSMHDRSDLDLAIVDAGYFRRINREVLEWAEDNQVESIREESSKFDYAGWQRDRHLYNCCRADNLPLAVCVHHQDTMARMTEMRHCGSRREVNAFIYRDWWSVVRRYEWDLKDLVGGVKGRSLTSPKNEPFPP